jgi:hypothetical protein
MSYPNEAQVRSWLENWARWSPSQASAAGELSQWSEVVQTSGYRTASIPIMGGEAGDTQRALDRMDRQERSALEQYYLRAGSMAVKAKRLRISKRTMHKRLHDGHHHFHELRWAVQQEARTAAKRNAVESATGRQGLQRKTAEFTGKRSKALGPKLPEDSSR